MEFIQGTPCWYELGTTDLAGAEAFYGSVLGWKWTATGSEGFDYRLAAAPDGAMVAGMVNFGGQEDAQPPNWVSYFVVDSCSDAAAAITAAGGSVLMGPADVEGTGRFAVCTDPQGAAFGILQPAPMEGQHAGRPFDMGVAGHAGWHELMTSAPEAAFAFYSGLFGWTKGEAMDMGDMGTYQLFAHQDALIGGMMGLGNSPVPAWLPYFCVPGVEEAMARITAGGGTVAYGPTEVPGGAYIAVGSDPQGAWFAVLGDKTEG